MKPFAPFVWWLALAGAASAAQSRGPAPSPMVKENATIRISDHVFVILDDNVPLVPNVGIIVGSRATMVIDTGLGPRNAEAILREVAKVSRHAELYLVTTHFHPEHAAGSSAFPPGTRFVVARAQQQDLDELGLSLNATFASRSESSAELLKGVRFRKPDVIFDREHAIDLGGLRVRLLALGPTHTRGDTSIFVEDDRVLFAGDIVFNHAFLAFSQYSRGSTWIGVLDQLERLGATKIVPSHGPMGDGSLIAEQRAVLKALQARVRELRAQGGSADAIAMALTAEFRTKYPGWTGPNRVGAAVRAFYAEP